jgi:hypothetical protein
LKNANRCAVVAVAVLLFTGARAQALPWAFTKLPPAQGLVRVAAPAQGIEALVFQVSSSGASAATVTQMGFRVTGNLPIGSLSNFELVAYPGGLNAPGVVVGTNDGSTWAHRAPGSILDFTLASPLALGASGVAFVLRANLNGGSYFFKADLLTVRVTEGGIDGSLLGDKTEDLPLNGDHMYVN